ncbi:aldo/keto reductase [Bacillus solimangrovi]|uniref:Oxidoreductase n=1 Tax=Bacillus solimangrovi TaxID=1305675 RepID=A0A1E5LHP4_9BACI|nr:aldo/keto reductase [Bacillus solimangrovi]OEH93603.1 oxidoreductase [Bacillus solimangrovi]
MEKRRLGQSDLFVSKIGLGCMSLGQDQKQATEIIHAAIDAGINYLDTADLYDLGLNEEFVGKAIEEKRKELIIATKVGNHLEKGRLGWYWDPSKSYIKEQVKNSLKRLRTDYIDLYQLHGGTIEDPIEETIEAFEELKKEGYIREYGISSIRPNVIREYVKRSNIVTVMMQYSILDRRPEGEMLELLQKNNISVIARGPLAKGMLSDKGKEKARAFLDYSYEDIITLNEQLHEITNQKRHLHETALLYPLYHSSVGAVIPGASSVKQVITNAQATQATELTEEEYEAIQHISKANMYDKHRS